MTVAALTQASLFEQQPKRLTPIDHWASFAEFARFDRLAGGPDSHMATWVEMTADLPAEHRAWAAGLYASVYNVPMAELLLREFPTPIATAEQALQWLDANWKGVILRRERRRPVGSPKKLAACLAGYAAWAHTTLPRFSAMSYDQLWESLSAVPYIGRYSGMKLLECLRKMGLVSAIIPDLRAAGGWSPREGLALLLPDDAALLVSGGDGAAVASYIHRKAEQVRREVAARYEVVLDEFEFEVFICDYKQAAVTRRQYPGRSLDSELGHRAKLTAYWGDLPTAMFTARRKLFPWWALGEQAGWGAAREDLGPTLVDYGYMWTDSLYQYPHVGDQATPVLTPDGMKVRHLSHGIYVRGHTRGVDLAEVKRALRRHGITRILCVAPQRDARLADECQGLGVAYQHIPLSDGKVVPHDAERAAQVLVEAIRAGRNTLVHCNAGRNRSPFVAALALCEVTGRSGLEMIEFIRERRPLALANAAFEAVLLRRQGRVS